MLHPSATRSTRSTRRRPLLALAAGLAVVVTPLAACGSDDESADTTTTVGTDATDTTEGPVEDPEIAITDAWVRPAAAGGNTAAYMKITGGQETDQLVGVSVPADVAAEAQIHETVTDGGAEGDMTTTTAMEGGDDMGAGETTTSMAGGSGMMKMQQVQSLEIPAEQTVTLEPGGYHIMMMNLSAELAVGDLVELTLTFEHGGQKVVSAEVKES